MAKYFVDISIHLGMGESLPNGVHEREFNITTHTVQDLFWYNIPPKFVLKNISKLNLEIYGKTEHQEGLQWPEGIVMYNFTGFDFEKYFKLSKLEQNFLILKVLELTMKDLLKDEPEKLEEIVGIIDSIKQSGFNQEFGSDRLSKWDKSRKYRGSVVYRINDEGENAYFVLEDKDGNTIMEEFLLKNHVYDFHENLNKAKWKGSAFQILSREGKVYKQFELSEKL